MTTNLQPGARFDQYTLERRLGGGGFGEVWLARNLAGAQVALKVLHGQYPSEEVASLRAEIELLAAAASSRSSHIVRVLGGGSDPEPFVVMEFIEGRDLSQIIASDGALPIDKVLDIAEGIADALATLGRAGIIHRDIKAANVIIDSQGVVKLTDFGIAKIVGVDSATATGQVSLSMAYAAPEVWDGKASTLSDYYAYGALLFQCLTGRAVFMGNYAEIYRHHLHTPPDLDALPANTPVALREMIGECLAKAPEQRPQSASILLSAVEAARREMNGDAAATMVFTQNVEPRRLGSWILDRRLPDADWTFACTHQTSGEKALVELHFSNDLGYMDQLRKAVDVNASLVPLGAERLIGTSRVVMRPGEAWQNAPDAEFQFWVAREIVEARPAGRSISSDQLHALTDALNSFLAVARSSGLSLDMRAPNLDLRPDGSLLVRRPGLPPFPGTDPAPDVVTFLESLPLYGQTIVATPPQRAAAGTPAASPIAAAPAAGTPIPPRAQPAAPRAVAYEPEKSGGSKLVLVGAGLGVIAAVAIGGYLLFGDTSHSNTKGASSTTAQSTPAADNSSDSYGATPAAAGTPSSSNSASASLVSQGLAAAASKDYTTANTDFSKAIDADPKNAEAYYRRGLSFVSLSKPDQALPDFNKAIDLSPNTSSYYIGRADLEKSQKKSDTALADFTKAIALDPQNANPYFDRGTYYGDLLNYDAGIADLTKATELNPKGAPAFNNRGVQYRNSGKGDLAIADFSKAIDLDSKYVLPVANRSRLYYDLKRYDEALVDANKTIDLDPSSLHYLSRGLIYTSLGKPDLAGSDYLKATQLDPKNAVAFNNLALAQGNQKLYDDGVASATKSIAIDPNYYTAYITRGLLYKSVGKVDLARADFEKAKTLARNADEAQKAQQDIDSLK